MMQSSPAISLSPSFTNYSNSSRLAEIAARVVEEFRAEGNHSEFDCEFNSFRTNVARHDFYQGPKSEEKFEEAVERDDEVEEEEEFEFATVGRAFVFSPTPADEIFCNGQIRPIYPVFNRDLELNGVDFRKPSGNFSYDDSNFTAAEAPPPTAVIRQPLRKLFIEDSEPASSCSSSEADELDGVPADTYCVWVPKLEATEGQCKKSNSTGSSKRWRFRDLLHRSHSDGKDRFVYLTPSNSQNSMKREEKFDKIEKAAAATEIPKVAGKFMTPPKNNGERRRTSYLPYRQELVGLFSNANGFSRNLHPF